TSTAVASGSLTLSRWEELSRQLGHDFLNELLEAALALRRPLRDQIAKASCAQLTRPPAHLVPRPRQRQRRRAENRLRVSSGLLRQLVEEFGLAGQRVIGAEGVPGVRLAGDDW